MARPADQPSAVMRPGGVDVDRRLAEAFQAPEGVWNRDAERIRLDLFALAPWPTPITIPAETAALIDQLRASQVVLTYDPNTRTLRVGRNSIAGTASQNH